jgi:GT2 family glycosyltransferase
MISVIVSSCKSEVLLRFTQSLTNTIGTDFELITIENQAQYSLCQAYNLGIKNAKFPFLCFVHEDVIFKTNDWGKHLITKIEHDKNIGLIGIAGTKFKSTYPLSGWGQGPTLQKYKRGHIYHQLGNEEEKHEEFDIHPTKSEFEEVVCVDGVFLFSTKEVFETCSFDSELLNNFHGYDTEISIQIFFRGYKIMVDRTLEIVHFSGGNYSPAYTQANRKISKKWKSKLPVASRDLKLKKFSLFIIDVINWIFSGRDSLMRKFQL